jgi:hypothetical protein
LPAAAIGAVRFRADPPKLDASNLDNDTLLRLAELPNIVGV